MDAVQSDMYEVLDENGLPTGQILDKQTVHRQQLLHAVAHVWLLNNKREVLMQLRAPGVDRSPNTWDVSIGTHIRPHESPLAASLRCLKTELNVTAGQDDIKHLFNLPCANPLPDGTFHNVLEHVYLLQRDIPIEDFAYNPEKISKLMWVPLTELMVQVGNSKAGYLPRSSNYYPMLFEAFQAWL